MTDLEDSPADQPSTQATAWQANVRHFRREALSVILLIASALVLALGLIAFVFQSYQVSGSSMQQTLHNGDHLIILKTPRTWARITGHPYVPNRGNIIVFSESAASLGVCGDDQERQLIKRVIGLPGDRVLVAHDTVEIFNQQHPKGFFPDASLPYGKHITEVTDLANTNAGKSSLSITLNNNQIFVLGDNRTGSCDSRYFGPVNLNSVIGKLVLRVLPLNNTETF